MSSAPAAAIDQHHVIPSQGDLLGDLLNLDLGPPVNVPQVSSMQMGAVDLLGGGLDSLVSLDACMHAHANTLALHCWLLLRLLFLKYVVSSRKLRFSEITRAPREGMRSLRACLFSVFVCVWSVCDVWMVSVGASHLSCSWGETWAEVLGEVQQ